MSAPKVRPARGDFAHFTRIVTRWGDMDSLGHINNAKFFTYDEQARLDYFEDIGKLVPDFWKVQGIILARISCDFIQQLRHPANVDVGLRIRRFGRTSMETEAAFFQGDTLIASSQGVIVWFNYQTQSTAPIDEAAKAAIRAREVVAPLEG